MSEITKEAIEAAALAMAELAYSRLNSINPTQEKVVGTDHFERWFAATRTSYIEHATAALSTLPIAGEGKVKALEWVKHPVAEAWRADTMLGSYQVWIASLATGWQFDGFLGERINEKSADDVSAKAAAQADYETRILSALISSPGKDGGQEVEPRLYAKLVAFLGKVQGVSLGIAMSGKDHPNPDGALMDLFNEAQKLYQEHLAAPSPQSTVDADAVIERLTTSADEIWMEPNPPADPIRGQDWSETNAWGQQATKYVRADIAETLTKALEPFAEAAASYDPPENDDDHAAWAHDFTIGSLRRARSALAKSPSSDRAASGGKFARGDRVTKTKGSSWTGRVVGFYSTELTPIGYAVESETERGSVQIYPESALAEAKGSGQ